MKVPSIRQTDILYVLQTGASLKSGFYSDHDSYRDRDCMRHCYWIWPERPWHSIVTVGLLDKMKRWGWIERFTPHVGPEAFYYRITAAGSAALLEYFKQRERGRAASKPKRIDRHFHASNHRTRLNRVRR